jgi:hypothetical protein
VGFPVREPLTEAWRWVLDKKGIILAQVKGYENVSIEIAVRHVL